MKKIISFIFICMFLTCNADFNISEFEPDKNIIYFVKGVSRRFNITYTTSEGLVKLENPILPFELTIIYEQFEYPFQFIIENEDSSGNLYACINEVCEYLKGEGILTLIQRIQEK